MGSLIARIRRWWRAEIDLFGMGTVTACVSENGLYEISIDDKTYEYTAKWWDTKRSIARKLGKLVRQ